jgi:hypothetical protein
MLRSVEILTGLSVTRLVDAVAVIGEGYDVCREALNRCEHELEKARSENA